MPHMFDLHLDEPEVLCVLSGCVTSRVILLLSDHVLGLGSCIVVVTCWCEGIG